MPTETVEPQVQQALTIRDELIVEVRPIQTEEDRQWANQTRVEVKRWLDGFGAIEKEICDPIYRAWKNAKDRFKVGRAPAEAFDKALEDELRADRLRQQAAIAKEQKRQNDLAQKRFDRQQASGKGTPLPEPVAPIVQDTGKKVQVEDASVSWVDNWVPQIVDESLIPREYLMPDMTKLKAAAKAGIKVDGVRRVNEPYQRVR